MSILYHNIPFHLILHKKRISFDSLFLLGALFFFRNSSWGIMVRPERERGSPFSVIFSHGTEIREKNRFRYELTYTNMNIIECSKAQFPSLSLGLRAPTHSNPV